MKWSPHPWILIGCLLACSGEPPSEVPDSSSPVIATFRGGEITAAIVDEAILALEPARRDAYRGGQTDAWRDLVRDLALDEMLVQQADANGFIRSESYRSQLEAMERQVLVQQCLLDLPPQIEIPTEDEVRERYELGRSLTGSLDQRFVLTIFKRFEPGESKSERIEELEALRARVLDGESFALLAESHSDSESRHTKGAIGWIQRGQLPPEFDELIFSLPEEVPSRPLISGTGVHLFYIETGVDAELPTLEEAREEILEAMIRERQEEALARLVADTALPDEALVPDRSELSDLWESEQRSTVLLRLGDFVLTRGELSDLTEKEARLRPDQPTGPLTLLLFNGIKRREVLYHHFSEAGCGLRAEIRERFERQSRVFLRQRYREHLLEAELSTLDEEIRTYFEEHRQRFMTPLQLRLEALVVPMGSTAPEVMARLESARPDLDAGSTSLEDLRVELGGEIQTSDWTSLDDLSAFRAKAGHFAVALPIGHHSPPYNSGPAIEIFRVLDRREPQVRSFELAEPEVRSAFSRSRGQEIFEKIEERMARDGELEIYEERLSELAGLAALRVKPGS